MSRSRLNLGDAGERLAGRHLVDAGWRILERNWRGEGGEIDLIADDGDAIVFIEVKTRRGERFGRAEESISPGKAARLLQLGSQYIDAHEEFQARYWRVDLLAITLSTEGRVERVTHIRDAFVDG